MAGRTQPADGDSQRPDLSYPLIANGLDYLVDVVDQLATLPGQLPNARALKYAVLHLQAATEVLLKARLQREHWTLVFRKPETATRSAFDSADFDSCSTDEAFARLTRITGLALPDKAVTAVKKLARDRNALQHYGLTAQAAAVEARTVDVLNFLLPFISGHLVPGLDQSQKADVEGTLDLVRGQLQRIESFLTKRMNEVRAGLQDVQERTVACPECAQLALVLGSLPSCRFCLKTWDDPGDAAAEYVWQKRGKDPFVSAGDATAVHECPDCDAEALVIALTAVSPDTPRRLCFSCVIDFTDIALTSCEGGCGRPLRADANDPTCLTCSLFSEKS
ncbi:hypothetical protein [Streptomyces sp. NPDC002685]|uniref:hypothetical protein n=1 Tax=Streptomyces sp. NPDC002685 TaxID=3154540 RepID=UPI003322EE25